MSEEWNWKLARIEELLYRREYPSLEKLAVELGINTRSVHRLIVSLKQKGRKIGFDRDRNGYRWVEEPVLPLMVEEGYAGNLENHVSCAYAIEHELQLHVSEHGSHTEHTILPLEVTRAGGRAVLRAATLPGARLLELPLAKFTVCTAEKFQGNWEDFRRRAEGRSCAGDGEDLVP